MQRRGALLLSFVIMWLFSFAVLAQVKNCTYVGWEELQPAPPPVLCSGDPGVTSSSYTKRFRLDCWHDSQVFSSDSDIYGTATGQCYNTGFPLYRVTVCNAYPYITGGSVNSNVYAIPSRLRISAQNRRAEDQRCFNGEVNVRDYECASRTCTPCPQGPCDESVGKVPADPCYYLNGCQDGYVPADYGCCQPGCPLLIDLIGSGFRLTSQANGVDFDMNGDGNRERLAWTAAGAPNAWLALDVNGNGSIDSGPELFGNFSDQPSSANPNGFLALAEFDKPENGGNLDRRITKQDVVYTRLLLWTDANHDGMSSPEELAPFSSTNTEIDLKYHESKKTDEFGNEFRYRSRLHSTSNGDPAGKWIVDVFLAVGEPSVGSDGLSMLKAAGSRCKPTAKVQPVPAQ